MVDRDQLFVDVLLYMVSLVYVATISCVLGDCKDFKVFYLEGLISVVFLVVFYMFSLN